MKKNIPNETLDAIVADKLFFKAKTEDIANKYNLSRAFVDATVATYKHVSAGNWDKIQFMLDGGQMRLETAEWAAAKCGVEVPESFYQKPEPVEKTDKLPEQLEGQTKLPDFDSVSIKFSNSANNTLHALINALEKNANESAQLRQAVFALLHSSGVAG